MDKTEAKECGFAKGSSVKPCTEECKYYNTCTRNPYRKSAAGLCFLYVKVSSLQYDREQYSKGYKEGYAKAIDECIKIIEETTWRDTEMLVEECRTAVERMKPKEPDVDENGFSDYWEET